jgi:alkaline phosphatase D
MKKNLIYSILVIFTGLCLKSCVTSNQNIDYVSNKIEASKTLETIAFGSCNRSNLSQKYWQTIDKTNPDLWIWLGDMIYADTDNMDKLESMYKDQKSNAYYADFESKTSIIGIWDDHDYGVNDGGKNFAKKKESQQLMFDFLNVSKQAEPRKTEGIYQSYTFGENGKKIKIILLDTRYFRDDLQPNPTRKTRYLVNETGDVLGEAQWKWLEDELVNSTAEINIIGSSIQILAEEQIFEKWANFPVARQRFLDLIAKTQPKSPILLSGDRHIGEIAKIELDNFDTPIYEITSSGLTHAYTKSAAKNEINKYRINKLVNEKHFAVLKIDWETGKIVAEIHNMEGKVVVKQELL